MARQAKVTRSPAQQMYESGYGCSCHISAPCSFCTQLNEKEAEIWCDGDNIGRLIRYWEEIACDENTRDD